MIVDVDKLWNKDKNDWSYVGEVEEYVMNIIANGLSLPAGEVTEGYAPEYDFTVGNLTFELKCTTADKNFFVETHRADGKTPSGLSLCEADYYVQLAKGWKSVNKGWQSVGKLRLIPTHILNDLAQNVDESTFKDYPANDKGPGSCGFIIPTMKNVGDILVGECEMDGDLFDLSTLNPTSYFKNVAGKSIRLENEMKG